MRIVIAPDKFKGCLRAEQVAEAIAQGLRRVDAGIEIDLCPLADGGEGTVDALVAATGGRIEVRPVMGPIVGMRVDARFGVLGDGQTAVIEMSAASGLHLLKPELRNPMRTTTYGTGELLRAAVNRGAKRIILGIGGSATVDGGIGCVQGWGGRVRLDNGSVYTANGRKLVGADVEHVLRVEGPMQSEAANRPRAKVPVSRRLPAPGRRGGQPVGGGADAATGSTTPSTEDRSSVNVNDAGIEIVVACDVGNPLFGPDGAAAIFGPQKGATPQQVVQLDHALERLAERTGALHLAQVPGAGAAGGLGFGMLAFFGATLRSGIEIVMDASRFRQRLAGADLCITGEGQFDAQSLGGKTTIGVARLCKEAGVPCIVLAGAVADGAEVSLDHGVRAYFSICNRPMSLEDAVRDAGSLLAATAANVLRLL